MRHLREVQDAITTSIHNHKENIYLTLRSEIIRNVLPFNTTFISAIAKLHTPPPPSSPCFAPHSATLYWCDYTYYTTTRLSCDPVLNGLVSRKECEWKSSRCTARAHTRTLLQTRARDSSLFNVHPRGTLYHRSRTVCYTSLGREGREGNETQKKIIDTMSIRNDE